MDVQFKLLAEPPAGHLIANVNLVPFVGPDCLIIHLQGGYWEIPGGTLEPGETYLEAMRRELLEEAGAILFSFHLLGAWFCRSHNAKPYRPHLPHPEFYRLVGYGQVEITTTPQNPAGGEWVTQVKTMPVDQAAQRFLQNNRPDLAELYQLAGLTRDSKGH